MPHCFIGLSKDVYYYFAHNSVRSSADRENKINSRMILYVDMLIARRREQFILKGGNHNTTESCCRTTKYKV